VSSPWASSRRLWLGLPVLLVLLWVTGTLLPLAAQEIPQAPWITWVTLPMATFVRDVAAAMTVGAVVVGGLLTSSARVLRWASLWALLWLAAVVTQSVLTVSDVLAISPTESVDLTTLWSFLSSTTPGRVFLVQAVAVLVVALLAWSALTRPAAWVVTVLAVGASAAPAWVGHAGVDGGHTAATISLAMHIASISLWVGGLATVVAYLIAVPRRAALVLPRYSTVALICVLIAGESGLLNASLRVGSPADFVTSTYGALTLGKAVLLGWLVWFGWQQRTRVLPTLDETGAITVPKLAQLAGVELFTMGVAIAVAITMTRVGPVSDGLGFYVVNPFTLVLLALALPQMIGQFVHPSGRVATALRAYPEVVVICLCVVAIVVAGVGVVSAVFGEQLGALIAAVLLVGFGLLAAVALQSNRPTFGIITLMVGWVVVSNVVLRFELSQVPGGFDLRESAGALLLALIIAAGYFYPMRTASRQSGEVIVVSAA